MFTHIENAIAAVGRGEIVIVVDDEDRENEGDLIMAAEKITPEAMGFFVRHTSGVICMPMLGERLDELQLPLMVSNNTESQRTAFTVSVDAVHDVTTGISAADRATTVRTLDRSADARSDDFARPGHIFPLRYREGGVLKRAGHTEAAVDLARLAGLAEAGVLAEVVNDDGTMARLPAAPGASPTEHGLHLITIADLIRYRRHREKLVRRVSRGPHPDAVTATSPPYVFESLLDGVEHMAFVCGEVAGAGRTCSSGCTASASPATCSARCAATAACSSTARSAQIAAEGRGRGRLPARPRGPRHRPRAQAARVHAAGPGPRHRRGERGARLPGRLARVRHRLADPRRPRHHHDAGDDEQPGEVRRPRGLRARDRRAGAARDRAERREHRVPAHQAGEDGAPARPRHRRSRRQRERVPHRSASSRPSVSAADRVGADDERRSSSRCSPTRGSTRRSAARATASACASDARPHGIDHWDDARLRTRGSCDDRDERRARRLGRCCTTTDTGGPGGVEVGWTIAADRWRRGLRDRGRGRGACEIGFGDVRTRRARERSRWSDNVASRGVMEKLGFRYDGDGRARRAAARAVPTGPRRHGSNATHG